MRFSRKTDYGIILMEELKSTYPSGEYRSLSQISEKNRLPYAFLEKLAGVLRQKGFLESKRGSAGGYRLRRDPKHINLKQLIEVFEEPKMMRCMNSPHPQKYCPLVPICPTRKTWMGIENRVNKIFEKVTLGSFR